MDYAQVYLKLKDGVIAGTGPNPYKYPKLPKFAGLELGQIINENEDLLKNLEVADQKDCQSRFCGAFSARYQGKNCRSPGTF